MHVCGICGEKKGRYIRYRGWNRVDHLCYSCFELVTRMTVNSVFQGHRDVYKKENNGR